MRFDSIASVVDCFSGLRSGSLQILGFASFRVKLSVTQLSQLKMLILSSRGIEIAVHFPSATQDNAQKKTRNSRSQWSAKTDIKARLMLLVTEGCALRETPTTKRRRGNRTVSQLGLSLKQPQDDTAHAMRTRTPNGIILELKYEAFTRRGPKFCAR